MKDSDKGTIVHIPLNCSELQTILIALKDRKDSILRNEVAVEDREKDYLLTNNVYNKVRDINNKFFVHVN